jgi:hypothetical protein
MMVAASASEWNSSGKHVVAASASEWKVNDSPKRYVHSLALAACLRKSIASRFLASWFHDFTASWFHRFLFPLSSFISDPERRVA